MTGCAAGTFKNTYVPVPNLKGELEPSMRYAPLDTEIVDSDCRHPISAGGGLGGGGLGGGLGGGGLGGGGLGGGGLGGGGLGESARATCEQHFVKNKLMLVR